MDVHVKVHTMGGGVRFIDSHSYRYICECCNMAS